MTDAPKQSLDRVDRAISSAGRIGTPPPELDEATVRQVGREADLASLFADRAEAVGATVRPVRADGLAGGVAEVLAGCDPSRVLYHREVIQRWPALGEILSRARPNPGADDDGLFEAQAGITLAEWGVAETGSVVCTSGADRSRLTSLVPPLHVAILDIRRVLPDLCDLLSAALPEPLPSCASVITGPSKTADLEGILLTGMHGPGRLHVFLVESGRQGASPSCRVVEQEQP